MRCLSGQSLKARTSVRSPAKSLRRGQLATARAGNPEFFGEDFGARDPFAAEIESNFCEKVLGNWDTEHLIKAPDSIGAFVGLAAKSCSDATAAPLEERERERLRNQVPGWRVVDVEGRFCIRHDWTAQDSDKAEEIKKRVEFISAKEGKAIDVTVVASSVFAVLPSALTQGELSENDFIVAAKVNNLELADVLQKKRAKFWA
eukprot:TRINITY_DN20645_c0_g1_i1.p1 TRINITY_DN20645_c0_g1~~TRINITY_DN20645_c0_g1_i1.p1  ORF type:complete len:227 (+),score=17.54 TRINITY_DN20645_c0_g1_i1:73-681(+)